jgi:DedD protein
MAEKDTSPDADLQLKKRARRRLVGAAALALFAVIVLPMVMDREPRPLTQDIQVRIPSQDSTGLAARVLPGKPAATPMPAPEPKPVVEAPAAAANPAPEPMATKPVSPPVVAPAVVAAAAPAQKPAEKPAAAEKKAVPAEKPVAKPAAESRSTDDASGQWVVQLGAYKEAGNVKLLLAKLKGVSVPAYTEKFDSPQGPRTRVRAGPFATQEAAEKARARIKIIGVDGPVAPK